METNDDDGEEEKENEKEVEVEYMGSGDENTTQIKPTDSSEDDKMVGTNAHHNLHTYSNTLCTYVIVI